MAGGPPGGTGGGSRRLARSLEQYFKWRLCEGRDTVRCEPLGYCLELDRGTGGLVLRHEASGVSVAPSAIDMVQRPDRNQPGNSRIVYVYVPRSVFCSVLPLATRDPLGAFQVLVDARVLGEPFDDERTGQGPWHCGAVSMEPALALATTGAIPIPKKAHQKPWQTEDWCVPLHMPSANCRRGANFGLEILRTPHPTVSDVHQGDAGVAFLTRRLHDAVRARDQDEVRAMLHAGAKASFVDARGWNALHTAASVRPKKQVLNQLLRVSSDVCARTLNGELPSDIADVCNHEAVARDLKERMQHNKLGRHLPQAASVLSASASRLLGIDTLDNEAAHEVGRRREEAENRMMLAEFANAVLAKYPDSDTAFKAFDINGNGTLSQSEFIYGAKMLQFKGDLVSLFKALDRDRLGDISVAEFSQMHSLHGS